ncbi:MAG TPA: hypothetical protein VFA77_13275, partial [Candidatus Eisenbacteria bacterium]|nr:hypothetical protein [Candidatus Eisenbacteria bacterium]
PGQKESLTNALAAFQKIIDSPRANVSARDIAEVGVGVVFEAQAQQRPAEEQIELLKRALGRYLDVFYGRHLRENEKPDLWWTKKAGLEAARLAEKLQWWQPAINVYRRLKELVPSLIPFFETRIRKAEENLPTAKSNN